MPLDFRQFDQRGYPTQPVREGYGEWAESYDRIPLNVLDLPLLDRITSIEWSTIERAIDLACGTGRIGIWLRDHGIRRLDGLDFTPEMLARARERAIYDALLLAPVENTGLPSGQYDLATMALADEHLSDLRPLYAEAARIIKPHARFVLIGYHPHFLLNGLPTHYHRADGEPVAIESYVHLLSDHVKAAHATGWTLREMDEWLISDAWIAHKPSWERWRDHPFSFCCVWELAGGEKTTA
jgi:SAM-dependent methyltransferase